MEKKGGCLLTILAMNIIYNDCIAEYFMKDSIATGVSPVREDQRKNIRRHGDETKRPAWAGRVSLCCMAEREGGLTRTKCPVFKYLGRRCGLACGLDGKGWKRIFSLE